MARGQMEAVPKAAQQCSAQWERQLPLEKQGKHIQRAGGKLSTTSLLGGKSPERPCDLPESGDKRIPVRGNKESARVGV